MTEVSQEINAAERRMAGRVLAAGQARSLTISRVYGTTIGNLWDACTNPDRIRRWFVPVSGDLRAGGRFQIEGNASGKIERCDPPTSFAITWEFGGSLSWVEVRLSEVDGGTRCTLEHVVPADEHWSRFGPGAVGVGWDMAVKGLADCLSGHESGQAAKMAWMTSAEGSEYITLSSQRWCEANIAGGADEAWARAAAERTTSFYTTPPPAKP